MKISQEFRGQWTGILSSLGVAPEFLRNKHGPCPFCGGKDRFRYDDKDGCGTFFCNQCGAGDGMTYAQRWLDADFRETIRIIRERFGRIWKSSEESGRDPQWTPKPAAVEQEYDAARKIREVWMAAESIRDTPAWEYLLSRGIPEDVIPDSLRYHPKLWNTDSRSEEPALVAAISRGGKIESLQRLYLARQDGKWVCTSRKTMPPVTTITGGAIYYPHFDDHRLGIAEGLVTALSCVALFGIPTWAAVSAHGMTGVELPAGVDIVYIYGDHDASYTGQEAAYSLARKVTAQGIVAHVFVPNETGWDYNDVLQRERGRT